MPFFCPELGDHCAMNGDLKSEILMHCDLYNKAEKVFKKAQLESLELDTGVLNEFRYCARAQVDLLGLIANSDGESLDKETVSALEVGNRALLCAINDSIDTIIDYAKVAVQKLEDSYPHGESISDIYTFEKYLEFWESIKYAQDVIAESRERRESRLNLYCQLVDSDELQKITAFCAALKIIEDKMRRSHRDAQKNTRQWGASQIVQLLIALGTGVAATVAIMTYVKS